MMKPSKVVALGIALGGIATGCGAASAHSPSTVAVQPVDGASSPPVDTDPGHNVPPHTPVDVEIDDLAANALDIGAGQRYVTPLILRGGLITVRPPAPEYVPVVGSAQAVQNLASTGLFAKTLHDYQPEVGLGVLTDTETTVDQPDGTSLPKYVSVPVWVVAFHAVPDEYGANGSLADNASPSPPTDDAHLHPITNVVAFVNANGGNLLYTVEDTLAQTE